MQESSYRYETYSVLFNNIKGLLIILVVLGHLIEEVPLLYNSAFGSTIHKLIYSFHMEAFVFISGYYSKNISNKFSDQLKQNLFPYLCLMFFVSLIQGFYNNSTPRIFLYPLILPFIPVHSTWYFLSLFCYRCFLTNIRKHKSYILFSLLAFLGVSFIRKDISILAFGRTISFLPFFLIGYHFKREIIIKCKELDSKKIMFLLILYLVIFYMISINFNSEFFFLRDSFITLNVDYISGIIGRTFLMIASLTAITLLIHFTSNSPSIFTKTGRHSLSIYFFHLFFVYFLRHKEYFTTFSETTTLLILTVYALIISFLLSRDIVYNTLQYVLRR